MKVENKIALALNLDCEKRTIICSSFGCFSQEWSLLHNGIQTPEQKPFIYKESTIRPWSNIKGRGRKSYHSIDSKLSNASIQKNCLPGSLQHQIIQNKLFWMFCLFRTNGKILINLWSWFARRHHFRHWKACNKWLVFWDVKALILFVLLRNLLCKLIHKHAFLVESPARVALHCTILLTDNTCSPKASYSNHAVQHKDINEMPSKNLPPQQLQKSLYFQHNRFRNWANIAIQNFTLVHYPNTLMLRRSQHIMTTGQNTSTHAPLNSLKTQNPRKFNFKFI